MSVSSTADSRSAGVPPGPSGDSVQVVYSDIDGTMVGRRGCFFRTATGEATVEPAAALVALHEAAVPLVLVSGRNPRQLLDSAVVYGADGFIAELGALVGWAENGVPRTAKLPAAGPRAEAALVEAMFEAFDLRYHAPWHEDHEIDVLIRGQADADEVHLWLAGQGADHLRLMDNGVVAGGLERIFHLLPAGISKAAAVAWDLDRRGIDASRAVAIGDSPTDLEMAAVVGDFYLVANGAQSSPGMSIPDNCTVTAGAMGIGWAEAVRAALARSKSS